MKILHVNDHLAPKGGVETYMLSAIPRLEADGFSQAVVFGKGDPSLVENCFEIPEISTPGWGNREATLSKLKNAVDTFQPDVVHLHNIHNADAIEWLLDTKPVVVTTHDFRYLCPASNFYFRKTESVCEQGCGPACFVTTLSKKCMSPRPKYAWKYYRRVVRTRRRFQDFKHLIAPCQDAKNRFVNDGFPEDNVTVLPYFCRITPMPEPRPVPERPTMLYLGRLGGNKGGRYFIEALGRLSSDVQGMFIGNVDASTEVLLKDFAEKNNCSDRLTWRHWATQDEISAQLMKTSVLVFPSLWPETLGIVGLEAMAHGVPVVASDIGGVPEWLKDGKTGYRVQPKDVASMADRISKIIADPTLAHQMGVAALEHLNARFLPERHLSVLKGIYEAAL